MSDSSAYVETTGQQSPASIVARQPVARCYGNGCELQRDRKPAKSKSHLLWAAINAFLAVVVVTLAGCGDVPPPQAIDSSLSNEDPQAVNAEREKEHSQTYITCRATFTAFEKDHPWFDDSSVGHDHGSAPLASFVIVEPASYANRGIGMLFKYQANADTTSPPDQADIGSQFSFQIPADFLSGNHQNIDNSIVTDFHQIEPE